MDQFNLPPLEPQFVTAPEVRSILESELLNFSGLARSNARGFINYLKYDAVVDLDGNGTHSKVSRALTDGKKTIFVKDGSYTEDVWTVSNANTVIIGESYGGVIITFTNTTQGIALNASNVSFQNLDLNGTQADTTALVKTNGDKTGCSFDHCIFDDAKTYVVDATTSGTQGSGINFANCTFEGAGMDVGTSVLRGLKNASVLSCTFNLDVAGGTLESVLLDAPRNVTLSGCTITANYLTVAASVATLCNVAGNHFSIRNLFCSTTNFSNNSVIGNASASTVVSTRNLFTADGASRVISNYFQIHTQANTMAEFASFCTVAGNHFEDGNDIDIIGQGVNFTGNLWSTASTGAVRATLTAASSRCIYGHNILRAPSAASVAVTNSGTNNVVSTILQTY